MIDENDFKFDEIQASMKCSGENVTYVCFKQVGYTFLKNTLYLMKSLKKIFINISFPDSALAAPSLSLLPPSSEELKTDKATLACLVQMSAWFADVSWTSNESPVTDGVFTSSAKQQLDKTFSLSSFLTIKPSEWTSGRVFSCKVSVGSRATEKSIKKSDCSD